MKKLIPLLVAICGVGISSTAFALQGGQFTGVNVGLQWFFDQDAGVSPLSAAQCSGSPIAQRDYYLSGDMNNDGKKDLGAAKYYRDNFVMAGGTISQYLILPRYSVYSGTKVRYYMPEPGMMSVLSGTSTLDLLNTYAWYRFSKLAPKDQWVRAVESQPMLLSIPTNPANKNMQIAYEIHYADYVSKGTGISNYQVFPVANASDMAPAATSYYLNNNFPNNPVFPTNFTNTFTSISTQTINWSPVEKIHSYECMNITLHWCGDGIKDTSNGEVCDNGVVNGTTGNSCNAVCTDAPVVKFPDVTIAKAILTGTLNHSGDNLLYGITYNNIGSGLATGVTITDLLPSGVIFSGMVAGSNPVISGQQLTWTLATLPPLSGGTLLFWVQSTGTQICHIYRNNAFIAAVNEPTIYSGNNVAPPVDYTSECQNPSPDLKTWKAYAAMSGTTYPNDMIQYTLNYQNIGNAIATGVVLQDTLPGEVSYISGAALSSPDIGQPTLSGRVLTWAVGDVAIGATGSVTILVQINTGNANQCSGLVVNNLTISGSNEPNTVLLNNPSSVTFPLQCTVIPTLNIMLNKLVNGQKTITSHSGDTVTYSLIVTNTGNSYISGFSVQDYLPSDVTALPSTILSGVYYTGTQNMIIWTGLNLSGGASLTLTFQAIYASTVTKINYAEVCEYPGKSNTGTVVKDQNSDPCNNGANTPHEDDESQATITPPTEPPGGCTGPCCSGNCGGGGGNYCGDGLIQRPNRQGQYEECDDGLAGSAICSTTCKDIKPITGFVDNKVTCDYIDPPSVQTDELVPYRWDLDIISGLRSTCAKEGDIIRNSIVCTFTVRDARGNIIDTHDASCFNPATPLANSAFVKTLYGLGYSGAEIQYIRTAGFDARHFNFTSLGEHKIQLSIKSYNLCEKDIKGVLQQVPVIAGDQRVCEMNFAVTKPYMVSRGPLGDFASDPLTSFLAIPGRQVFASAVPQITQKFDVNQSVINGVNTLVSNYEKLAVSYTDLVKQYNNKGFGMISKVPGKDIYIFAAKTDQGTITISDDTAGMLGNKPFTIIITKGSLVVKGSLTNAARGMYIVPNGNITFAMDTDNYDITQQVNGIFITLHDVKTLDPAGTETPVRNTNPNGEWYIAGDLSLQGITIGNNVSDMYTKRRSNVNTWFSIPSGDLSVRKEYILNHGAVVLKYNPDIFDHLPPGAEILSQVLQVYKK